MYLLLYWNYQRNKLNHIFQDQQPLFFYFVKKNNRLPTANEAQIALQLIPTAPPAVQSQLMVVNGPSYRFMNDDSYEILFPTKDPANPGVWIVFPYTKAGVLMLPMNGTKFMNALPGMGPNTQMEAPRK